MAHPVLRVAHRGHPAARRENTLDGFAHALDIGCDWLEIDVRTTKDGRSVVLHDATLRRLWGLPAAVSEVSWAEVQALGGAAYAIPLLEDVLALAKERSARVLVDATCAEDSLAALDVVRSVGGVEVAYCGDVTATQAVRDRDPEAAIQMNHPGGALDLELVERLRPTMVNSSWADWTAALVEQVHGLGLQAWAWTANEAGVIRWLRSIGIDAITSDRLRLLNEVLSETPRARTAVVLPVDERELSRSLSVAGSLAQWANAYTADAPLGSVVAKAHDADVVTEVDTAVERRVREVIAAELPGHVVVGEEEGGEPGEGPTWYLDPVDGTTNLANRLPWTSFSLAMAVGDRPLVAAVGHPWLGEVMLAAYGMGATRDGRLLQLDGEPELRVLLTELAAHAAWPGMLDMLGRATDAHVTLRVMGSGTLTLAGIAAGWGQAAVIDAFSAVDHLAALLLVREAGGVVLDDQGQEVAFPPAGTPILAAHPAVAQQAYELWRGPRG